MRAEILAQADAKMTTGAAKHGPWDPDTDTRDLLEERAQEQLDAINYAIMDVEKIRRLQGTGIKVNIERGRLVVTMPPITHLEEDVAMPPNIHIEEG